MIRRLAGVMAGIMLLVGVLVLREQTMTRHEPAVSGTATEVVVRSFTHNVDPWVTPGELVHALLVRCRLEVDAQLVGDPERLSRQRYRFLLAPALDEFDERQLHGCLEDARVDHLQLRVERLRRLATGASAALSSARS